MNPLSILHSTYYSISVSAWIGTQFTGLFLLLHYWSVSHLQSHPLNLNQNHTSLRAIYYQRNHLFQLSPSQLLSILYFTSVIAVWMISFIIFNDLWLEWFISFTSIEQYSIISGIKLMIVSELMLFFSCFWSMMNYRLSYSYFLFSSPVIVTYSFSIPFSNLVLLLFSSLPIQSAQLFIKIGFLITTIESIAQTLFIGLLFFPFSYWWFTDSLSHRRNHLSIVLMHGCIKIVLYSYWFCKTITSFNY